jgi:O-antigen/teichoic acid export membrane protein
LSRSAGSPEPAPGNGRVTLGDPGPGTGGGMAAGRGAAGAGGAGGAGSRGYGRGARILSVGIATTGLVTFAYFSVASHVLDEVSYKRISLLWSIMFIVAAIIYRPIEQLLSRTIAERRARGEHEGHPLRIPGLIQAGFAAVFAAVALALRDPIESNLFDGSATLYWILVCGVLFYAASYFARGWLGGHQRFALYGGLVLAESISRFLFALAVAVGIAEGQSAVALGMAAAPALSLVVVPWAFSRARGRRAADAGAEGAGAEGAAVGKRRDDPGGLTFAHGTGFAVAVLAVMFAEQVLLNAAVLTVDATAENRALAGFVFNVLLIARAPLQLFQSIQATLLPHLAGLQATAGRDEFARAIRVTVVAIAGFAGLVTGGLLLLGPFAMDVLFGGDFTYERWGLALIGLGMGLHLTAGTLNQAALARRRAGLAAFAWVLSAALFVGWLLTPAVADQLLRVQVGYFGATLILSVLLYGLYRRDRVEAGGG